MDLLQRLTVSPRNGAAFTVDRGQIVRIVLPEGPQVVDFNAFDRHEPRNTFSSSVTRARHGAHPTAGHRLISRPPWERVMFTITQDTVEHAPNARGAASHDLLYGRCTRGLHQLLSGIDMPGCQEILTDAIAAHDLSPADVHDPLNVFMRSGIDDRGMLFIEQSDARKGDLLELRAEMDCLVAVSACPSSWCCPVRYPVALETYRDS